MCGMHAGGGMTTAQSGVPATAQGKLLAGGCEHILKAPSEGTVGLVGGAGGDTLYVWNAVD